MLEGFAKSIMGFFLKGVKLPTYSLICKRLAKLQIELPQFPRKGGVVVILDASGMKVVGEGEWKVKVHGRGRPRKWVKIHIALDEESQEVIGEVTTTSRVGDASKTEELLKQIKNRVKCVKADGVYDKKSAREAIAKRKAGSLIPPPKNGRYKGDGSERDKALLEIRGLGGDKHAKSIWGKLTGYIRRVFVEVFFSRSKRLFGERFYSKTLERQRFESRLRCVELNRMLAI